MNSSYFTTTCDPIKSSFFFFNDTATTEIYTLSLHDALPIYHTRARWRASSRISRSPCRRSSRSTPGSSSPTSIAGGTCAATCRPGSRRRCPRSRRAPGAPTRSRSRSCKTTRRVGRWRPDAQREAEAMPPLLRPRESTTITLAPRTATVAAECDVLVVGGGPAGLGAAIGAADAGADVILVERHAFLGGNATAALVMPLMSFHTQRGVAPAGSAAYLMAHDHGPGDPVVEVGLRRLLSRLGREAGALHPAPPTRLVGPVGPEGVQ